VLVTKNPNQSLWESILPECCRDVPPELARVDALLDDVAFFEPYRAHFDPEHGRRSTPVETYLRMMFLKFRYKLSYEVLCREVADSISWRRFCHIPLGAPVPHPTTLMKITTRCGEATIERLNETLLQKATKEKVLKTDKLRADTTVVEANVTYPTDSGLLAKAVARMARLVERIHAAGGATRTKVRDRRRAAARRVRAIAANLKLRNDDAKEKVRQINAELATLAEKAAAEAVDVARNARRKLARSGANASKKLACLVAELETTMALTATIVAQTRTRLGGEKPDGAIRVVSLHDPDARPIAKGRLGKPVEFGYKAQVVDNADGVVVDHRVVIGNPPDAPMLAPAIARIKALVGRAPRAVTADGIYGEAAVEDQLVAMGVKTVVIPRKGKPSAARREVQGRRSFRKLVKWRTGCEGRISHLKHSYAWNRTLLDGIGGAETWCGLGVLAHNAVKISALLDAKPNPAPRPGAATPSRREPTGPPPRGKPPALLFN
jgi:transposase, IS5 family